MISIKSIKTFFKVNIPLLIIGYFEYLFDTNDLLSLFISTLMRNCVLIDLIDFSLIYNKDIGLRKPPNELYYKEFQIFLLSSTIIETLTSHIIQNYFLTNSHISITDLITFIPISFCFEVMFDFLHYTAHRLLHNKYLYKYLHKTHHKFIYPTSILTFYQHPVDVIISNSLPTIYSIYTTSLLFTGGISLFQFKLINVYKTFIEISGHTGKLHNSSSFSQFFWLPKLFGIELSTRDHDLHHTKNNCNYAKRFSLWDKIFGTYSKE